MTDTLKRIREARLGAKVFPKAIYVGAWEMLDLKSDLDHHMLTLEINNGGHLLKAYGVEVIEVCRESYLRVV